MRGFKELLSFTAKRIDAKAKDQVTHAGVPGQ